MKYEKPDLEEIKLELEASFLAVNTYGGGKDEGETDGEEDWA